MRGDTTERSIDGLRLERTAARARKLLSRRSDSGRQEEGNEGGRGLEATGGSADGDVKALAARLMSARNAEGRPISATEAQGIARTIVANADRALVKLDGAPDGSLDQAEAVALEAVIHVRGRPAVRVLARGFEDINLYPEADMWKLLADTHFRNLWTVTTATAAVQVTDRLIANRPPWAQGTAFLIGPNLALTNRHVLFPPQGVRLARRYPGTTTARMKGDYDVLLNFAFDNGEDRKLLYRITDVPFVAEDADPVDAALLRVEPVGTAVSKTLTISRADALDLGRLYIVGHPGYLENVPEDIMAVFGRPDERKRISFGELMDPVSPGQKHIVHDCSTIGGYSGAAVLTFDSPQVRALHYWGDSQSGNRAIPADAIIGHPALGGLVGSAS